MTTAPPPGPLSRRSMLRLMGASGVVLGTVDLSRLFGAPQTLPPADFPQAAAGGAHAETLAEIVADLQYDVDAIFGFVRDEIAYEPYSGVLRGPTATLQSRAGNAADQAVLLHDLLTAALVPVRFAVAPLTTSESDALYAQAVLDAPAAENAIVRHLVALRDLDMQPVDDPALAARIAEVEAAGPRLAERIAARTEALAAPLQAALAEAGIAIPSGVLAALPTLEIDRHLWVQYADGPAWIDLDPSNGESISAASDLAALELLTELPAEWFHTLTLRIRVEELSADTTSTRTLLEHQVRTADLADRTISFVHAPPPMFEGTGAAITEMLTGVATLYPTFAVGRDAVVDQPVTFDQGGGGLDGAFDDGSGVGGAVAEWLDLEVAGPDATPRAETRTIFDRAGAAARAAGTITADSLEPVELITLPNAPEWGAFYAPLMALRSIAVATGRRVDIADPATSNDLDRLAGLPAGFSPLIDVPARDFHREGFRTIIDRPRVVLARYDVEAGDDATGTASLDLIHRGIGLLPLLDVDVSPRAALLAGVTAHVVERTLLDGTLVADFGQSALPQEVASAGLVLETAASRAIELVAHPAGSRFEAPSGVSGDVTAILSAALDSGLVVVAPAATVAIDGVQRFGWWLVDPATGEVRDQLDNGEGSVLSDYGAILNFVVQRYPAYKRLGCATAGVVLVAQLIAFYSMDPTKDSVGAVLGSYGKTAVNTWQAISACL